MRLPLIAPSDLTTVQRDLYDDMRAGIPAGFNAFKTARDDGALIGPWNASLHHPEVGKASWELTKAIQAVAVLTPNVKETVILVVAGHYNSAYEIYAHTAVAKKIGMPLSRISALVFNIKPDDLASDESVAFDAALALCKGGPLPEPVYRLTVETFGLLGASQLIYLVGIYSFVATALNGFDVPVPQE